MRSLQPRMGLSWPASYLEVPDPIRTSRLKSKRGCCGLTPNRAEIDRLSNES
jgi:hypothetical protein